MAADFLGAVEGFDGGSDVGFGEGAGFNMFERFERGEPGAFGEVVWVEIGGLVEFDFVNHLVAVGAVFARSEFSEGAPGDLVEIDV